MYWSTIISVLIEEEIIVVTTIVTHQGVETLIDSDAPPNPKCWFIWSEVIGKLFFY